MTIKTLEKYINKWAVIDEKSDEIIAASGSYRDAYKEAGKSKLKNLYIKYIVPPDTIVSPNAQN